MDFNEADKCVHPVETQWHYPIMIAAGYTPGTKEAVGFVRTYCYIHPSGQTIACTTGYSADYWSDRRVNGYWKDLEPHLEKLKTLGIS